MSPKKQEIVDKYVNIINHLYQSEKYNEKAFLEWSGREDIADPWIIATASGTLSDGN